MVHSITGALCMINFVLSVTKDWLERVKTWLVPFESLRLSLPSKAKTRPWSVFLTNSSEEPVTFNLCHPDCGQEPQVSAVGSCQYWRRKHFFHSHNVLLEQIRPPHTFEVLLDVPNNTCDPEVLFILFIPLKSKCSHANRVSAVVSGPVELLCRLSLSISLTSRSTNSSCWWWLEQEERPGK